jgi:predicted transcriptional regulator
LEKTVTHRGQLEIWLAILQQVNNGSHKQTQIMGLANLNWRMIRKYLDCLIHKKLLSVETCGHKKTYWITPKGKKALEHLREIMLVCRGLSQ